MTEYEVYGVYIDQISAAPAYLCSDPSHLHTTSMLPRKHPYRKLTKIGIDGGNYWYEGYYKLTSLCDEAAHSHGLNNALVTGNYFRYY